MKKTISVILSVVLVFTLSVTAFAGNSDIVASGYCGGEGNGKNLEWTLDSSGTLTISGRGGMANYEFYYEGALLVPTAPWEKYRDDMKKLVIEEGVTSIGKFAFYGCSKLKGKLVIPESVTSIGWFSFGYCYNLRGTLTIPESVTNIGESAFFYCYGFDGLMLNEGLSSIGPHAFSTCYGLKGELVIPETVTKIGGSAFNECKGFSGSLVIPEGVTKIESYTFSGCSGFDKLVLPEKLTAIDSVAFKDCSGFTGNLVIPDGVTTIGISAFENCSGFTGCLEVPAGIAEIDFSAFKNCGINEYYFENDAPKVKEASAASPSFDTDYDTIYYPAGNPTWIIENGKWNGYNAERWGINIVYGDVNGDEKINVLDANLVRKYAAKLIDLDEEQLIAADVNGDGKINVLDANLIRKFAAKLIDEFPIEG